MRMLTPSVLLCALMLLSSVNEVSGWTTSCLRGWNGKYRCFRYIPTLLTWAQAERNCISMGGNLASVHSLAEYHQIQSLVLTASHGQKDAWIGGADGVQEGVWFWSDGTVMNWSNWCPGQPNDMGHTQHCMEMTLSGRKCWNDFSCRSRQPSVCVLRK